MGFGQQIDQFANETLDAVQKANMDINRAIEAARPVVQEYVAGINRALSRVREEFAADIRRLYEAALLEIELDARAAQKQVTAPGRAVMGGTRAGLAASYLDGWPCFGPAWRSRQELAADISPALP